MSSFNHLKVAPAINLDFIQSQIYLKWSWLGLVILIMGLLTTYTAWTTHQKIIAQQADVTLALQDVERQKNQNLTIKTIKDRKLKSNINPIKPEQIKELMLTTSALNMPWSRLLDGLEQSSVADVAVLGLQPDAKKKLLTLSGEAKNLPVVLAYIDRLEKQPMLDKVILQKHNVSETDKDKPVRFTLLANWQTDSMSGVEK